jgi:uncharacterized membrane protein YedE/YeeE
MLQVGAGALAGTLPVVDGLGEPSNVAVDGMVVGASLGGVGEFAVWFGESALGVVATDGPVRKSAPAGEPAKGEQRDYHLATLQHY